MTDIDNLKNILCCPLCHAQLEYLKNKVMCAACGKEGVHDGRVIDFKMMSPSLPLHINACLEQVYESAGEHQHDLKSDFRITYILEAIKKLNRTGVCLEIGGADGPMTPSLEAMFDQVITLDRSISFLKRIERKTNKTLCIYGDGQFQPIQNSTIDVVICTEVLEHVTIPAQLLMELRRVMKKDAILILTVPNEFTPPFARYEQNYNKPGDAHLTFFTPHLLALLLTRTGFEIIQLKTISSPRKTAIDILYYLRRSMKKGFMGDYIFCILKAMSNPMIYWDTLSKNLHKE